MGLVRIWLPTDNYEQLDAAMERTGYSLAIPGKVGDVETWFALPRGCYWRDEPTTAEELLDGARTALQAADELGWRVLVTAGETSWEGLEAVPVAPTTSPEA